MREKYLATTFSLSMLPCFPNRVSIEELDERTFAMELADGFKSVIGHESTAKLLSQKFNKEIQFNRASIQLKPYDKLLVVVPQFRAEEAREFSEAEIKDLKFRYFIVVVF